MSRGAYYFLRCFLRTGLGCGRTVAVNDSIARAGLKITKEQDASASRSGAAVHGLEACVISDANARGKLPVIAYDIFDK